MVSHFKVISFAKPPKNGVFGAKIMWSHLEPFLTRLGRDSVAVTDVLAAIFPDIRYLWISRDDKLRQAISMWKAKQTKVYNSLQAEGAANLAKDPVYDFNEIGKIKRRFEDEDAAWGNFFTENNIVPVQIRYEDFADHHEERTLEILRELAIDAGEGFTVKPLTYKPLADSTNEQWRERYLREEDTR